MLKSLKAPTKVMVVKSWRKDTLGLSWGSLIEKRGGVFDPEIEEEFVAQRVKYFYPGAR